jgi:hypothetical protein
MVLSYITLQKYNKSIKNDIIISEKVQAFTLFNNTGGGDLTKVRFWQG